MPPSVADCITFLTRPPHAYFHLASFSLPNQNRSPISIWPSCLSTRIAASGSAESLLWLPRPLHSDALALVPLFSSCCFPLVSQHLELEHCALSHLVPLHFVCLRIPEPRPLHTNDMIVRLLPLTMCPVHGSSSRSSSSASTCWNCPNRMI